MQRYIIHVDMDAFYAAVEQRDNPQYRNKAVIIGSDPQKGRGVVSTCSYEAREYGVHSAMPISKAYALCPDAVFIRPNMDKYLEASRLIFEIFNEFSPHVEGLSVDEAFIDISGSHHLFGGPLETAKKIKSRISNELNLTASVGLAPNKMLAKIASDLEKPDGLTVVESDKIEEFLYPLSLKRLWGVGAKTLNVLNGFGLKTIGDLANFSAEKLAASIGKHAYDLHSLAQGHDQRPVLARTTIDSLSNEHTFMQDVNDREILFSTLMYLSQKVSDRLRFKKISGKTISIKVRFSDFKTYTRSKTLAYVTNYVDDIYKVTLELIDEFLAKGAIRLIGVKVTNWESDEQISFGMEKDNKKEMIHDAVDKIKTRYGKKSIGRARAL